MNLESTRMFLQELVRDCKRSKGGEKGGGSMRRVRGRGRGKKAVVE